MKVPAPAILGLILFVAKATGYCDWSWWAVTCPIWGSFAAFGATVWFVEVYGGRR